MCNYFTKPTKGFLAILIFLHSCNLPSKEVTPGSGTLMSYDSHVHLMSPDLIADWKALGIPFSKPEAFYSDIDTILERHEAERIDLIGMGYVYGSPDFYQGTDRYERIKKENDYLWMTSQKHPDRIRPFFTIDPLKNYALDELKRCAERSPDSGLKLHFNASQVYLTEPSHLAAVKPIFQQAAEKKLPILLHFDNSHPKFGEPDVKLLVDSILHDLPALKISIAHFGTSGGFNEKTKRVLNAFVDLYEIKRIPSRHQLFFDISAVALDKDSDGVPKLSEKEFEELNAYIHQLGVEKIIFGTDYPLYTTEAYHAILKNKLDLTEEELSVVQQNTLLYSNRTE